MIPKYLLSQEPVDLWPTVYFFFFIKFFQLTGLWKVLNILCGSTFKFNSALGVMEVVKVRLLICQRFFLFTAMAESRMSNCWVGQTTLPLVSVQEVPVAFVPQLPLWTLSLRQRPTMLSTCWMNARLPPSIMSRLQYRLQRVRPRPAHRLPALATQVLRPPWILPLLPLPCHATTFREYKF